MRHVLRLFEEKGIVRESRQKRARGRLQRQALQKRDKSDKLREGDGRLEDQDMMPGRKEVGEEPEEELRECEE